MLVTMNEPSTSANDPGQSTSPGPAETAASFARHDVAAPDEVVETEEATFDRHDVGVGSPDSVNEEDEATFDRHDR